MRKKGFKVMIHSNISIQSKADEVKNEKRQVATERAKVVPETTDVPDQPKEKMEESKLEFQQTLQSRTRIEEQTTLHEFFPEKRFKQSKSFRGITHSEVTTYRETEPPSSSRSFIRTPKPKEELRIKPFRYGTQELSHQVVQEEYPSLDSGTSSDIKSEIIEKSNEDHEDYYSGFTSSRTESKGYP